MYSYENAPFERIKSNRQPGSPYFSSAIFRSVSKCFNRISDFIFPDTIHISCPPVLAHQQEQPAVRRYQETKNCTLPLLNRNNLNQRDLIIIEQLPAKELDNVDLLYREQYYQPNEQVRRPSSSIIDDRRIPPHTLTSTGFKSRSVAYRERLRDRRKRYTADNVHHSTLKSTLEEDQQQHKNFNYILSYRTTLDPITDSESMISISQQNHTDPDHHPHQQQRQQEQQQTNDISRSRVPIKRTMPIMTGCERLRRPSSTISSLESSSDTDITQRYSLSVNRTRYSKDSTVRYMISSCY